MDNSRSGPPILHTCQHCGHQFYGRVCNNCGEKVFDKKSLGAGHFFHEVIDFFFHFESKVVKTLKLNITRPGFVTKENLRGVRVPYAGPVQLYLVTAVIFFVLASKIGVTDYTPQMGDHRYFGISSYPVFKWMRPLDEKIEQGIDDEWENKEEHLRTKLVKDYYLPIGATGSTKIYSEYAMDSVVVPEPAALAVARIEASRMLTTKFNTKVEGYSKTLIFLLLPIFALVFFLFFRRKIEYYGAALILATHFMVFNLCFFLVHAIVDWVPARLFGDAYGHIFATITEWIFYNRVTAPVSSFLFGSSFECFHFLFWIPWLFIAFRRIFGIPWWQNLFVSYICSKIFFFLIYGLFKKVLIAFAIWAV